MNRRTGIHTLVLIMLCAFAVASGATAASWTDFGTARFSGIAFDKPLQVGVLDYTLTIGNNPTMTVGSNTYKVNWIQSVYVLSGKPGGTFTAANGSGNTAWTWDSKTSGGGQISGWTGQGNDRLYPGQSKMFHFSSFDPKGNPIVAGYHVSYNDGNNNVITRWWKQDSVIKPPSLVPEPSSLVCMAVAIVSLFAHVRRRNARRAIGL